MSDPSAPFLPATVEREVKSALAEASIYTIGSYGWLNADDADPEFIGHAMWQTDQPSIDYTALWGEAPVRRRPKDIEKEILSAGTDFCGMMEAARLSIGLTLLWHRQAHNSPMNESPFFWLHHTDAFLKLAIASDRLRDLLIAACTGASPRSYKVKGQRNRQYVTPYEDALSLLAARGFHDERVVEPSGDLPKLAKELFKYIGRRNKIVHELATREAKHERDSVSELQQRYDQEQEHGFAPQSDADWSHAMITSNLRDNDLRQETDRAIHELRNWYVLLIRTSNCVFQIEYWSRVLG